VFILFTTANLQAQKIERIDNLYTFIGQYSYFQVLTVLTEKSKRSVVGNDDALKKIRYFAILDKNYNQVIQNLSISAFEDGYYISSDSISLRIQKIVDHKDTSKVYSIKSPFSDSVIVTENRSEFFNFVRSDSIKSLQRENNLRDSTLSRTCYRLEFDISGSVNDDQNNKGIKISDPISLNANVFPQRNFSLGVNLSGTLKKIKSRYDFSRKIVVYCIRDTTIRLNFGSEVRRPSVSIESDRVITQSYESVFDGLTIETTPFFYVLKYRVGDSEINITGIPDSTSCGSANVASNDFQSSFFLPSRQTGGYTYHIASQMRSMPVAGLSVPVKWHKQH